MKNDNLKMELNNLNELPSGWTVEGSKAEKREAAEELRRSDREILGRYNPSEMARAIEARAAEAGKREDEKIVSIGRKAAVRVLIPAAAAAVLALAVLLPLRLSTGAGDSGTMGTLEATRIKGAAGRELKIYRQSGEKSELLESGSRAAERDLLQLSYSIKGAAFGLILSVDGRGVVTRHLPEEGLNAARLNTGGEQFLPFSYELDDAPDFETFYLISSEAPFSIEKIMDAAAEAAESGSDVLDIPSLLGEDGLSQLSISIRKE